MGELFSNLFGEKSWYQSLTAWGLVLLVTAQAFTGAVCDPEGALIGAETCASVGKVMTTVGAVATALGLRKAAGST